MNNPGHLLPSKPNQIVILVAEDEVLIQNIVRIALEGEGHFILTAEDGEAALAISRQFPGTIHALLTDVRMPKMGGLELGDAILKDRPGIKVLLMSGYLGGEHPAFPLIDKPFNIDSLKERVRELLSYGSGS